jgi:hypothetical protein
MGGLVAVGAITAPIVAPHDPGAMTAVFRRFDRLAMACAAVVLLAEAARVVLRERVARLEVARIVLSAIAAGLATWQGFVLSARIEEMHLAGVRPGEGVLGAEFDSVHALAETEAKVQLVCLAIVIVLHVAGVARSCQDEKVPSR